MGKHKGHKGRHTSWGLIETGGGAAIAGGLLLVPPQPGWKGALSAIAEGDVQDATYNIVQSIPIYGKDPNMAGNRALVGLGIGAIVVSKIVGALFPGSRRAFLHLGRHNSVRVAS